MNSPFEFGSVITGAVFLDREEERTRLTLNLSSGINTILISPRRWGKTSLVAQVALENKDPKTVFCFLDLFTIRTEEEFYKKFATQLIKSTSNRWEEWIDTAKKFFGNLAPKFSFGEDPLHDFSITLDYAAIRQSAEEILDLPEKIATEKGIRLVVCLDEFQNIGFFDEPLAFQKQLRSFWQHHKQSCYIIYGSKKHMMAGLFQHQGMPFYRFGDLMWLKKIEQVYWESYIVQGFADTGKSITSTLASRIASLMENHPYYVQFLSYQCWTLTEQECNQEILEKAIQDLINQQSMFYQHETDGLTNLQINFLKAVTSGEKQLTASETVRKYNLGTPGNIKRMLTALENKEIIEINGKTVEIGDPIFKIWIKKYLLK